MNRLSAWVLLSVLATVAFAQTPTVSEGGVVNAASFAEPITPGSLVSIFGSELAGELAQAGTIPLSTQLDNVSVTFNNISSPLLFISGGQINAQLPWNVLPEGNAANGGMATLVVTRGGVSSQPLDVQVGPFSPGIFAVNFGVGPAIAIIATQDERLGALAAPIGSIPGLPTFPARVGDILIVLATGLGEVDGPVANGDIPPVGELRRTMTTPSVLIGGMPAEVQFSGLTPQFVGVNQLNVAIPPGVPTGDAVPLQLQVGGITSTDQVTITIEP